MFLVTVVFQMQHNQFTISFNLRCVYFFWRLRLLQKNHKILIWYVGFILCNNTCIHTYICTCKSQMYKNKNIRSRGLGDSYYPKVTFEFINRRVKIKYYIWERSLTMALISLFLTRKYMYSYHNPLFNCF